MIFFLKTVEETWWRENETVENKGLLIWSYPQSSLSGRSCCCSFCVTASKLGLWLRLPASLLPEMRCCARECREKPVSQALGQPALLKCCGQFNTKTSLGWDYWGLFCWGGECGSKKAPRSRFHLTCRGGLAAHCWQQVLLLFPLPTTLCHLWEAVWP